MKMATEPRPYDIDDPAELKRLLHELGGYLASDMPCRHEFLEDGPDRPGRTHALDALDAYRWRDHQALAHRMKMAQKTTVVDARDSVPKLLGRALRKHGYILADYDRVRIEEPKEHSPTIGIMVERNRHTKGLFRTRSETLGLQVAKVELGFHWNLDIYDREYQEDLTAIVEGVAKSVGIHKLAVHVSEEEPDWERTWREVHSWGGDFP